MPPTDWAELALAFARGDEIKVEADALRTELAAQRTEMRQLLAACNGNIRSNAIGTEDRWKMIRCCQRIAELLMTAGCFAEARVQLLLASGLWNAQVEHGRGRESEEKAPEPENLFPSSEMYEYYIACSEQVRDFVGANFMANRFLDVQKNTLKTAEKAFEQAKRDSSELEAREAKVRTKPSRYGKHQLKIQEAKEKIHTRLSEAKDAVEGATKLVAEWESRCRDLMEAFVSVCTRDRKAFREQHGDSMSDAQIDSLMKPRYNGGWFTPQSASPDASAVMSDDDERAFAESVCTESDAVSIRKENAVAGYGLFAERDFKRGDVIATFRPHVWATVDENACATCGLQFPENSVEAKDYFRCKGPCGGQETYCSEACLERASVTHHKQMCGESANLSTLRRSIRNAGISAASRMHYIVFKLFAEATARDRSVLDDPALAYISKQACKRLGDSRPKFLLKDWQLRYDQMIVTARLNGLDPRNDFYTFCLLTDAISANLFATGTETARRSGAPLAAGLYVPAIFINHSCTPNASWSTKDFDPQAKHYPFVLTARHDIEKGEEIFITYTEEYELDVYKRLQALQQFGVPEDHKCTLCNVQKALAPDVALDIIHKALCEWGGLVIRQSLQAISASRVEPRLANDRVHQGRDGAPRSTETDNRPSAAERAPGTSCNVPEAGSEPSA